MPAFEEIGSQRSTYYTNWGNRLNVPIIGYNKDKTLNVKIDGCAFKNIGGTLVISSGELALNILLIFDRQFTTFLDTVVAYLCTERPAQPGDSS